MPKTYSIPIPQTIRTPAVTLVNADSFTAANPGTSPTNTKLLLTAGADGSVVKALHIASNDGSSRTVQFWISNDSGTTKFLIGSVVVAANSGAASAINIDVLGNAIITGLPFDETGKPVLMLAANAQLYVGVITAAVAASAAVYVVAQLEDY